MKDPDQQFMVPVISRKDLASTLNEVLEHYGSPDRFEPGDDRLTDEICQHYADTVWDTYDCSDSVVVDEIPENTLDEVLGFDMDALRKSQQDKLDAEHRANIKAEYERLFPAI